MSFPKISLMPILCLLILSWSTPSLLLGQTPTPTPPLDTDGDGVPDDEDGWPEHKQLTTPKLPKPQFLAIYLGQGIGYGINKHGDVVGEFYRNNGESEAVMWRLGRNRTRLGFLTEDQTVARWSIAWGINDARQITGRSTYTWDANVSGEYPDPPTYPVWDYNRAVHAFLWQAGTMTDLNDLSLGGPVDPNFPDPTNKLISEGRAINRDGVVVGYSHTNASAQSTGWAWHIVFDAPRAAKFTGAAPIDLGITPADAISDATAINDNGAIVGHGAGYQSAFFQSNGQTQLPPAAAEAHLANGLNNQDHVVGIAGNYRAYLWVPTSNLPEEERFIDLHALGDFSYSGADAINDRDQVVGSGTGSALLWQNGKAYRLNDLIGPQPSFYLVSARAINQKGMIVANTSDSNDESDAYLLVSIRFVEVSPKTTDETGSIVEHSDKPKLLPHSNEMVEEPRSGQTPNVAYRVLKVTFPEVLAGERIKWSMAPLFTPGGSEAPLFRGVWPEEHPNRFEAAGGEENDYQYTATSQQEGTTVIDSDGKTAVRVNLPPIGFNKARVRIEFERFSSTAAEIDFEVPAVVVIDPGHGGITDLPGSDANHAQSPSNVLEKNMTLAYGLALRDSLRAKAVEKKLNLKVLMTRAIDENLPGAARAARARDNGADNIVIIHFNSSASHTARGTLEVRRTAGNVNQQEDKDFINPVINKVVFAIAAYDFGARKLDHVPFNAAVASDLNLGNTTNHGIRAGYIEVEFIDNPVIDVLLNTGPNAAAVKQAIADAMRDGIIQDLKHQPTSP